MDNELFQKDMASKIINSTFNMILPQTVGKSPLGIINPPIARAGAIIINTNDSRTPSNEIELEEVGDDPTNQSIFVDN